jgi:hypothetical protein
MNHRAIDCSNKTTGAIGAIKAAGVDVVIRYVGSSAWKCMDRAEANALKAAGLGIAAVYETTATMMLGGYAAGVAGAKTANAAVIAAGGPADAFIWFACDTDTSAYTTVNDYLHGAASVIGAPRCGIYGSGAVVASALASGMCRLGWRSLSTGWRGYNLRPAGLVLLQHGKSWGNIGGLDYDANEMLTDDVGQWGGAVASAPLVVAQPSKPGNVVIHALQNAAGDQLLRTEPFIAAARAAGYEYKGSVWEQEPGDSVPVYQLHTANHFYTESEAERDVAQRKPLNYVLDGEVFKVKAAGGGPLDESKGTAVYRMLNSKTGNHYYAVGRAAADRTAKDGYHFERIAFYV